jgi:DNA-binding MarR family transcriptional regulator
MPRKLENRQHVVNQRPQRTPEGDAFSILAITVIRLAGHLTYEGDALTKPFGQTSARWQVLAAAAAGPMSVAGMSRLLGVARQGVQRLANVLAREGQVEFRENPSHRRAKLVALTPRGEETLTKIRISQAAWADRVAVSMEGDALTAASRTLEKIISKLSE